MVQAPKKMSPVEDFAVPKDAPKRMLLWRCHGPDADFVVLNAVDPNLKDAKEGWVAGTVEGITKGSFADVTEQFESLTRGWPTVQITTKASAAHVLTARTIKFNARNIQLLATYPANKPRPKSVDLFLASLQIPDSVGTGPLTHPWPDFNEYKLGDSGISALFPKKPEMHVEEIGTGSQQGVMTAYYANYANQYYAAGYSVLPIGTVILPDDAKKARGLHV